MKSFYELADVIRCEGIPAKILWIRDTYEHVEIVDPDKRASVGQLQRLMNGIRFLREEQNKRSGAGGRPDKNRTYEEAVEAQRFLFEKYEESAFLTGVKEKKPTNEDVANYLGISRSKFYVLRKGWRREGLKWPPGHDED